MSWSHAPSNVVASSCQALEASTCSSLLVAVGYKPQCVPLEHTARITHTRLQM